MEEASERHLQFFISPGELSEELVTKEKQRKGWRMSCDVDKTKEGLENEL